jgi:hypothetical protein
MRIRIIIIKIGGRNKKSHKNRIAIKIILWKYIIKVRRSRKIKRNWLWGVRIKDIGKLELNYFIFIFISLNNKNWKAKIFY